MEVRYRKKKQKKKKKKKSGKETTIASYVITYTEN